MTATVKLHHADITLQVTLMLGEAEVRALDALQGYGTKAFLDAINKHISPALVNQHRAGLVGLIEAPLGNLVRHADQARAEFKDPKTPLSARRFSPNG